ncbi:MAG: putative bifunctional diguanylate cyclase/phosphodiesterase, partial [Pseudomonadales bacterium]
LTFFDADNRVKLYLENSTDPFAKASPEHLDVALKMAHLKLPSVWQFLPRAQGVLIQRGLTLDSNTLEPPIRYSAQSTWRVVITVEPVLFNRQLESIAQLFDARVEFSQTPLEQPVDGLAASVKLAPSLMLNVRADDAFMGHKHRIIFERLLLIALLSIAATFALLQWLIARFITNPIEGLDSQLTQVMGGELPNIKASQRHDEVSRLGRKFHDLYQRLDSAYQQSYRQARCDDLTGLANRVGFYEQAAALLAHAEREQHSAYVLYIDVDGFKFINDKHGHEVGDFLLKGIGQRISSLIQVHQFDQNVLARLSGDEFVLLLVDQTRAQILQFCDEFIASFASGMHVSNGHFSVSVSVGIASYAQHGHSVSQLVSCSDMAMYQAKQSGKNGYAVYSQLLGDEVRKRREIEAQLKAPSLADELMLHYMPIVAGCGRVKGVEALLRWECAALGRVPPDEFIPIAEETGCYESIDLWVFEQAFKDFAHSQSGWPDDFTVSLNVSSAEIESVSFLQSLEALCVRYALDYSRFIVEITETFEFRHDSNSIAWLQQLQSLGFKIAIDDFGTGNTSLLQMVDFPVDIIKFDKALVERICQPQRDDLARSLIELCHIQGLAVVAEGIEENDQYLSLQRAHCDTYQGYLFTAALPLLACQEWVKAYQAQSSEQDILAKLR